MWFVVNHTANTCTYTYKSVYTYTNSLRHTHSYSHVLANAHAHSPIHISIFVFLFLYTCWLKRDRHHYTAQRFLWKSFPGFPTTTFSKLQSKGQNIIDELLFHGNLWSSVTAPVLCNGCHDWSKRHPGILATICGTKRTNKDKWKYSCHKFRNTPTFSVQSKKKTKQCENNDKKYSPVS